MLKPFITSVFDCSTLEQSFFININCIGDKCTNCIKFDIMVVSDKNILKDVMNEI